MKPLTAASGLLGRLCPIQMTYTVYWRFSVPGKSFKNRLIPEDDLPKNGQIPEDDLPRLAKSI
jgi:hypothetical protein